MTAISILCEGGNKSPDVRLLNQILLGLNVNVRASGSKYGLGQKIKTSRQILSKTPVLGIIDRDFDENNTVPTNKPTRWEGRENDDIIHFGWRWERKEIENYLIDPEIVSYIFKDKIDASEYRSILNLAARGTAIYTAARTALSINRRRFSPLPNAWGTPRGKKDKHPFPEKLPVSLYDCKSEIEPILSEYAEQQLTVEEIVRSLNMLVGQCNSGGARFSHYMHFFSGKDLLLHMETKVQSWGFQSAMSFRSAILTKLEESPQNVWEWLPEWQAMRNNVAAYA